MSYNTFCLVPLIGVDKIEEDNFFFQPFKFVLKFSQLMPHLPLKTIRLQLNLLLGNMEKIEEIYKKNCPYFYIVSSLND